MSHRNDPEYSDGRKLSMRSVLAVSAASIALLCCAACMPSTAAEDARAPLGQAGLASKYPGDQGLGKDPAVIIYEGFEQVSGAKLRANHKLVTTQAAAGRGSLQFNLKKGQRSAGSVMWKFAGHKEVFFRYYRLFGENWVWPNIYGPHDAALWAGQFQSPINSDFQVMIDFWKTADTFFRGPNAYRQKELKGTLAAWTKAVGGIKGIGGKSAVAWNVSVPDKIVNGKWHCVEVQVRLSKPGVSDGIIRLWVNGKLVTEYTNVPMRGKNHPKIMINRVFISAYWSNSRGSPRDQPHWLDQLVVATKYIGPVAERPGRSATRNSSRRTRKSQKTQTSTAKIAAAAPPPKRIADPAAMKRERGNLVNLIVTQVGAGKRPHIFFDFLDRVTRARLVDANADSFQAEIKGNAMAFKWSDVQARHLYGIARRCADPDNAGHRAALVRYCAAALLEDALMKEIAALTTLDPKLARRLRQEIAGE